MVEIQFANQIRRHLHERKIQEGRSITNHQRRIAREKIAGSLRGWREESPSLDIASQELISYEYILLSLHHLLKKLILPSRVA
jgi:hypothetical protein